METKNSAANNGLHFFGIITDTPQFMRQLRIYENDIFYGKYQHSCSYLNCHTQYSKTVIHL
jgi:hypothetical protein